MLPPAQTRELAGNVVMMPPYVGITRIRFMGSSAGPVRAPGSSQRSPLPRVSECKMLNAKRTTAAATSGGVRIVELESGAVQAIDVIHFGAIHVEQAGLVDENLQPSNSNTASL